MQNGMTGRSATEGRPSPPIKQEMGFDGLHQATRPFQLRTFASSPTYCTPPAVPMFQPAVATRSMDFGRPTQPHIKQEVDSATYSSSFSAAMPPRVPTGSIPHVAPVAPVANMGSGGTSLKRPLPSLEIYQPPKRKCVPTGAACMHCSSPHHAWTECRGMCLVCSGQHPRRRCSRIPLELYLGPARGFTILERCDVEHAEPARAIPAPAFSSEAGNGMQDTALPRSASVAGGIPPVPSSASTAQKGNPAALAPHFQRISLGAAGPCSVPEGAARNRVLDPRPDASSNIAPAAMEGLNPQRVAMIAAAPKADLEPTPEPMSRPKALKGPQRTAANCAPLGQRVDSQSKASAAVSGALTGGRTWDSLLKSEPEKKLPPANPMMGPSSASSNAVPPPSLASSRHKRKKGQRPSGLAHVPIPISVDQETWTALREHIRAVVHASRDPTKTTNHGDDEATVTRKINAALMALQSTIMRPLKGEYRGK